MFNYSALIRVPNGTNSTTVIRVQVQAADVVQAKLLLEAQYGRGCIVSSPERR